MKTSMIILSLSLLALVFALGCCEREKSPAVTPLYEGAVWTLQWTDGAGNTSRYYRTSQPGNIPHSGMRIWDCDLYVRLYPTHIEIQDMKKPDLGAKIIPVEKLDFVQFGDGGHVFTKQ